MKKAILHIGFPKTGTTSIQSFCFGHRRQLKQAGVNYPRLHLTTVNGRPKVSHDLLTIGIMRQPPPRLLPEQARAVGVSEEALARFHRGKHQTLFLSDETLSQRLDLDFTRLTDWLAPTDVNVLAFVRTYDEWLESLYAQNVRSRLDVIAPFRRFRLGQLDQMTFLSRLRSFRRGLPGARFTILSFDRYKDSGLIERILNLLGAHDADLQIAARSKARINMSRPAVEVLFGAYGSWALKDPTLPSVVLKAFDLARQAGVDIPFSDHRFGFMPPDLKREAREIHRRNLPLLRNEFGLEADDPGGLTAEQADYHHTLSRPQFDALLAVASPFLPNGTAAALGPAYAMVADAFAA